MRRIAWVLPAVATLVSACSLVAPTAQAPPPGFHSSTRPRRPGGLPGRRGGFPASIVKPSAGNPSAQ